MPRMEMVGVLLVEAARVHPRALQRQILVARSRGGVNRGRGAGGPCDSAREVQGLCCSSVAARRGAVAVEDRRRPCGLEEEVTTMAGARGQSSARHRTARQISSPSLDSG
jgi:hypothetical protein